MRASPLPGPLLMVRVPPDEMLTATQRLDALVEVVEGHSEVPRVASRRFEAEARGSEHTSLHQGQYLEADQRWLLGQLVDRDVTRREDRDPVRAVDRVVAE